MAVDQKKSDEPKPLTPSEIEALKAKAAELDALKPALEGFKFRADKEDEVVNLLTEEGRATVARLASAGKHITKRGAEFNAEVAKKVNDAVAEAQAKWAKDHPDATKAEVKKAGDAIKAKVKSVGERIDPKTFAAKFEDDPEGAIADLVAATDASLKEAIEALGTGQQAEPPKVELPQGIVTEEKLAAVLAQRERQREIATDPRMVAYLGAMSVAFEKAGTPPDVARDLVVQGIERQLKGLNDAVQPGMPGPDLFLDVIEPALKKLGVDWKKSAAAADGKKPDGAEEEKPDSEPEPLVFKDDAEYQAWLKRTNADRSNGGDPRISY